MHMDALISLKMMYSKNKKAAQGIGTLIIFISLILVSAIAAAVLISTASSLQSKALDVGRQSQDRLTTAIEVYEVKASDSSDGAINASVDNYSILLRLQSGSTPVKLEDTIVIVDTVGGSQTLVYSQAGFNQNTSSYGITYLSGGSNAGYITPGDLVEISAFAQFDVAEEDSVNIQVVNDNGAPVPVEITLPSVMINMLETLYP